MESRGVLWLVAGGSGWCWVVVGGAGRALCIFLMFKCVVPIDFPTLCLPCRGTEQEDKWAVIHKA